MKDNVVFPLMTIGVAIVVFFLYRFYQQGYPDPIYYQT